MIIENNTEIMQTIKDSGQRREFDTGAVRDIQEGKGRCDLMPLDVISEIYHFCCGEVEESEVIASIYHFTQTGESRYLIIALSEFGRFDAWSDMFLEVAKHFEQGAKKYGEHNWQKGIPVHCYIDSAVRHYLKFTRGDKDEAHDLAFVWNLLCCIWTVKHRPEMNDMRREEDDRT